MWQAWVNGILGVWLFIAAFLNFTSTGNLWNDIIVGVIVAVSGYLMKDEKSWQGWLSVIIGVWLIIAAAFIPSLITGDGSEWNLIISGVVAMVAGFSALGGDNVDQLHIEGN